MVENALTKYIFAPKIDLVNLQFSINRINRMGGIIESVSEATAEKLAASIGSKVTYGGGIFAFFAGLGADWTVAIAGIAVAFIGLVINIYFKTREDKRQQALHNVKMSRWDGKERRGENNE